MPLDQDGRTHLAYKAEHAVDLETGAVVAVTVAGGAAGDTETILETLPQAGEHIAEVACATNNEEVGERVHPEGPIEAVTDKVKRHLVCKRWTIEKADENSNGIPWFVLHRPNSDKLRFHLPSLPWHWFDA